MTLYLDHRRRLLPMKDMTHPVVSLVRGSALCVPLYFGLSTVAPAVYAQPQGATRGGAHAATARATTTTPKTDGVPEWSDQNCLDMVGDDPFGARDYAQDWIKRDGGRSARHCLALALVELGDEQEAAQELDDLARKEPFVGQESTPSQRVVIAIEAARAWLAANQPTNAISIAEYGLTLKPGSEGLTLVKARAQLEMNDPEGVIRDVGALVAQAPDVGTDAYVLLASAERRRGKLQQAAVHIAKAIDRAPESPAALLERGIIRGQAGDAVGARQDWQKVLDLAPDTHEADMARQDLAVQAADPDVP